MLFAHAGRMAQARGQKRATMAVKQSPSDLNAQNCKVDLYP